MSEPRRDDVAAALRARRELGPDYDEAVADRLAERMHEEIARQVAERLARERSSGPQRLNSGQKVTVTVVAMGAGFLTTAAVVSMHAAWLGIVVWVAVALIGLTVNLDRR